MISRNLPFDARNPCPEKTEISRHLEHKANTVKNGIQFMQIRASFVFFSSAHLFRSYCKLTWK